VFDLRAINPDQVTGVKSSQEMENNRDNNTSKIAIPSTATLNALRQTMYNL
jgi:hypothetical protein